MARVGVKGLIPVCGEVQCTLVLSRYLHSKCRYHKHLYRDHLLTLGSLLLRLFDRGFSPSKRRAELKHCKPILSIPLMTRGRAGLGRPASRNI